MRNAIRLVAILTALTAAACQQKQEQQDQNAIIQSGNIPANADIETLPADESSGTPSDELQNGATVSETNEATSNGY